MLAWKYKTFSSSQVKLKNNLYTLLLKLKMLVHFQRILSFPFSSRGALILSHLNLFFSRSSIQYCRVFLTYFFCSSRRLNTKARISCKKLKKKKHPDSYNISAFVNLFPFMTQPVFKYQYQLLLRVPSPNGFQIFPKYDFCHATHVIYIPGSPVIMNIIGMTL